MFEEAPTIINPVQTPQEPVAPVEDVAPIEEVVPAAPVEEPVAPVEDAPVEEVAPVGGCMGGCNGTGLIGDPGTPGNSVCTTCGGTGK